jgi:hypothetical protein
MTVLAIEVEVNGQRIAVAGANDLISLVATIGAGGERGKRKLQVDFDAFHLAVWGFASGPADYAAILTWISKVSLRIGDSATFRIVRAEQPDPPAEVLPGIVEGKRSGAAEVSKARHRKRRAPKRGR